MNIKNKYYVILFIIDTFIHYIFFYPGYFCHTFPFYKHTCVQELTY